MYFHAVIPLVPLLGLVHLRVTLSFLVLGGRRRVDNGCVHDGTTPHHETRLFETFPDVVENGFTEMVLLQ